MSSVSAYWRDRLLIEDRNDDSMITWVHVHFLVESDLLTEIDGKSSTPMRLLSTRSISEPARHSESLYAPQSSRAQVEREFSQHLRLRLLLNDVLVHLYTTSRAYVHPSEIGDTVSRLSRDLEHWYRNLPLTMQFSRRLPRERMPESRKWHEVSYKSGT